MGDTVSFVWPLASVGLYSKELGVLVNRPLTNLRKATKKHFHCLKGKKFHQAALKADANHGNFLALFHFGIQAGDEVLKEHLRTAAGNALYTSKTVQNEMIRHCLWRSAVNRKKILEDRQCS